MAAPIAKPATVPSRPRTAFWPVLRALERRTDSVPSTTQKECCTPVNLATSTARPRPIAPRRLLCSHTEWLSRWELARWRAARMVLGNPSGCRPRRRANQPRRSAAADKAMLEASWVTAKVSSCARKLGSRELTSSLLSFAPSPAPSPAAGRAGVAVRTTGSSMAAVCSTRASAWCSSASACSSASGPPAGALMSATPRSSTSPARNLTWHAAAFTGAPSGRGAEWVTTASSHSSSSTSRTTAREPVLSPVGR